MGKIIIGMIGKAGAGKDTVADYLCENYGFSRVAFANPLKEGVKEIFMLTDEQAYDRQEREKPLKYFPDWTPRKLYQYFGTELLRDNFDDDIWIKLFKKRIETMQNNKIVVTDVRFPNELSEIRGFGEMDNMSSHLFNVIRPDHNGVNVGISNHASESHDLQGDFTIHNDGTIYDLNVKVDNLMKGIFDGHV
jgi:dephospho-CoA kinase